MSLSRVDPEALHPENRGGGYPWTIHHIFTTENSCIPRMKSSSHTCLLVEKENLHAAQDPKLSRQYQVPGRVDYTYTHIPVCKGIFQYNNVLYSNWENR
jgi:hypothetical protein